jgi:hypothetical protein
MSEPPRDQYELRGDVTGTAKSGDIAEATRNARNDLRNNAGAMGASVVTIDTNAVANAQDWTGRNQVALTGRAFRKK